MGDITVCLDGGRRGDSGGIAKIQLTLVSGVVCIAGTTELQQCGSKEITHLSLCGYGLLHYGQLCCIIAKSLLQHIIHSSFITGTFTKQR